MRAATNEELNSVRTFHAVTAWIVAVGIGVLSSVAVVMSATGMGFPQ